MEERCRYEDIKQDELNPEQNWELERVFDDALKRETDRHPELNSRRKKILFMQQTFGWEANKMEVAQFLGVDEAQIRRFLSKRGMRNHEYEEISDRFDGSFSVSSIVATHVDNIPDRRRVIEAPNPLLEGSSIKIALQKGDAHKAVFIAQETYRHTHKESY